MAEKKNKVALPLTVDEENKARQTNKKTIKADIKAANDVDPEFGDMIEGLTAVDQARRRKEQAEK